MLVDAEAYYYFEIDALYCDGGDHLRISAEAFHTKTFLDEAVKRKWFWRLVKIEGQSPLEYLLTTSMSNGQKL